MKKWTKRQIEAAAISNCECGKPCIACINRVKVIEKAVALAPKMPRADLGDIAHAAMMAAMP